MAAPRRYSWPTPGFNGFYELLRSRWGRRVSFVIRLAFTLASLALYFFIFLDGSFL